MKFLIKITITVAALVLMATSLPAQVFPNLGGQRAGVSGLTFLSNDLSPRSVGLGGLNVTQSGDGYSFLNNPALAVDVKEYTVAVSNLFYAADVNQSFASVLLPTNYGATWGLTVNNLYSGAMPVRTEFQPNGTGAEFVVSNFALGVGFSKRLSDMFSFGIHAKYIRESMAEYATNAIGIDMGFLYKTDFRNLQFAVAMQNFGTNNGLNGSGREVSYNAKPITLNDNPMPTTFKMGATINAFQRNEHTLVAGAQLYHPNDKAQNIRLGVEYIFGDLLFLRAGYKINVDGQPYPTGGVGVNTHWGRYGLRINYGVNPTDYLGLWHTLGISLLMGTTEKTETTPTE